MEHRRVQQLVPRRARQQPGALGGYTWQYWMGTRSLKPAEYQFFGWARPRWPTASADGTPKTRPDTRCCAAASCHPPGVVFDVRGQQKTSW
ncbi:hypothetical protein I552_4671 [Mycobacterium xenopi 3993]|nr:hypothetical protein I552_4671 [Mycobacterium xenopi 3993]